MFGFIKLGVVSAFVNPCLNFIAITKVVVPAFVAGFVIEVPGNGRIKEVSYHYNSFEFKLGFDIAEGGIDIRKPFSEAVGQDVPHFVRRLKANYMVEFGGGWMDGWREGGRERWVKFRDFLL